MFLQPTYYYHILTSEPRVKEWLIQNGIYKPTEERQQTNKDIDLSGRLRRRSSSDSIDGGRTCNGFPTADERQSITATYGGSIDDGGNIEDAEHAAHDECIYELGNGGVSVFEEGYGNNRAIHDGRPEWDFQLAMGTSNNELRSSPWKLICLHKGGYGAVREHFHILYVSRAKQWGHNSTFGRIIRSSQYKCEGITCLACLVEYLYSDNGREIIKNNLRRVDFEGCRCAVHQMGNQTELVDSGAGEDAERGIGTSEMEGAQQGMGLGRVDNTTEQAGDVLPTDGRRRVECQQAHDSPGKESPPGVRSAIGQRRGAKKDYITNAKLVLLLCEERAFTEGEGERMLTKTPEGIELLFRPRANERIKTAITIARILVFSETLKKRVERCRAYQRRLDPECCQEGNIQNGLKKLIEIIQNNDIDVADFAKNTFMHLTRQTGKRNNLFFMGPPSTGKTMIMESLVALHYNFARLTGLTPNSSFNFASLLNVNACFMDECKLTDNHFEQWKLLAAGSPMCTDVKYKERHNVENCVLYTCANHCIGQYVQVPEAYKAIDTRTIQYNFNKQINEYTMTSVFVWERLWQQYGYVI